MSPEEQQQVNAMRIYFERQCGNLAAEGANMAIALEYCAQQLKAAQEKIKELEKKDNVIPIAESK